MVGFGLVQLLADLEPQLGETAIDSRGGVPGDEESQPIEANMKAALQIYGYVKIHHSVVWRDGEDSADRVVLELWGTAALTSSAPMTVEQVDAIVAKFEAMDC